MTTKIAKTDVTYDDVIKNMFTNPKNGKRYAAEVIGSVLNIDPKEIYNNLEYIHPQIKANKRVVSSNTDIPFETDKMLVDIEMNRSFGTKVKAKNDTYI